MELIHLEPRQHLSAAVSLSAGVLYARATDAAPAAISVVLSNNRIRVTANGQPIASFRPKAVQFVILEGGAGNDTLSVAVDFARPALLLGNAGNDILTGGAGNDALVGGAGVDALSGGEGNNALFGGLDNDHLMAGSGNDYLVGSLGNDRVEAGGGNDTVLATQGSDTVKGEDGIDAITVGPAGNIDAGNGDDQLWVTPNSNAVLIGGAGTNQSFAISPRKGNRRLKLGLSALADTYHLTKTALRQV